MLRFTSGEQGGILAAMARIRTLLLSLGLLSLGYGARIIDMDDVMNRVEGCQIEICCVGRYGCRKLDTLSCAAPQALAYRQMRGLVWLIVASSLPVRGLYRSVAEASLGQGLGRGPFLGWLAGDKRSTLPAHTRLPIGDQTLSHGTVACSTDGEVCTTTARAYTNMGHRAIAVRGGGEAPTSKAPSSETKKSDSGPLWGALQGLGIGAKSDTEAKAEQERTKKQADEEKEQREREALRKRREERLKRELEERSMGETVDGDGVNGQGIMVAMDAGLVPGQGDAKATQRGSVFHDTRIWLDKADSMVAGMALAFTSLRPVLHGLRAMFGLSLLFYGHEFATLAFHIIVFRLSGWKKAAKSKNELVVYYQKARHAMKKAAADVQSAAVIARKDKLRARKEEMMTEKRQLLKDGRVSAEEARAFIDKYRHEIETIAQEQEIIAAASSSVLAIKSALSFKKLSVSVNSLYAAVVTSITASTFKRAGQLTLALTCGGLIKRTLFDLLGPIIDPIGYQIELETYVANIMRGPANLYITLIGFLVSAAMFFHFFVDAHRALMVTFVLLGARVVTEYVVAALNPFRRKFGMVKKMDNMPASATIYITLCALGFALHGDAGVIGDYICRPYIGFLGILNKLLNRFQISTIDYFS